MTIADLLSNPDFSEKYILQKLIMEYLDCTREQMWIEGSRDIPEELFSKIKSSYNSYIADQKPLEYILGYVAFFGNKFYVNENTLIPRPETEYMVQAITENIANTTLDTENLPVLIDVGTGCGVLGISVLLQNPSAFSNVFFTDISSEALLVAQKNSDYLLKTPSPKLYYLTSDLISFVSEYSDVIGDRSIILVANLPYIPEDTFNQNAPINVQKREPKLAFVGGEDGLIYYRKLLDQMISNIHSEITCFFEMITWQLEILLKEYGESRKFEEVKTFHFNIIIVKATKI